MSYTFTLEEQDIIQALVTQVEEDSNINNYAAVYQWIADRLNRVDPVIGGAPISLTDDPEI